MITEYTPVETITASALYVCPATRDRSVEWMSAHGKYLNVADGEYLVLIAGSFSVMDYDEFHERFTYRKRINDTAKLVEEYAAAGLNKAEIAYALGIKRTAVNNHYFKPGAERVPYLPVLNEADARMAGFEEWDAKQGLDATTDLF